jgi:hypothetical protein
MKSMQEENNAIWFENVDNRCCNRDFWGLNLSFNELKFHLTHSAFGGRKMQLVRATLLWNVYII